jgi:beta-glucanase (GH16 family)
METVFKSTFNEPDPRWRTRHVIGGEASDRCATVANGRMNLRIKPDSNKKFVTGHISTDDTFEFTYGIAEARMRFKSPRGAHSAFWLQTTEDYIPGQAEIDVIEHFGRKGLWHCVYWREPGQFAGEFTSWKQMASGDYDAYSWHTYGVIWEPDSYTFTIDGNAVAKTTKGLSDRPKMLILSILVSDWEEPDLQMDNLKQYKTEVEWVRVRQ